MADREDLIVNGYFFGTYEDADRARKELKNSEYLEERTQGMIPGQLLAIYDKVLDEKMFSTPVGWDYLKYLRDRITEGGISESEIRPIPLYVNLGGGDKKDYSHIAKLKIKPEKSAMRRLKDAMRISVFMNIVFVALIVVMFIITLSSKSPNIINYKTSITNQYSQWEESLKAREEAIRIKEAELEDTGSR